MQTNPRTLYRGDYRSTLEDPDTLVNEPTDPENGDTSNTDPITPEETSWKKRYGDLRSHQQTLNERIKTLETQLQSAQHKEVKIPSTKEELELFAHKYPDVFRHIQSIAMAELLREKGSMVSETEIVRQDLEKIQRELGHKKILTTHPDFEDLNASQEFHDWTQKQPKQIQDWLFESTDPNLCIKAIDLYKAETAFVKKPPARPRQGADTLVNTRSKPEVILDGSGGKRIWKASEIAALRPKEFERLESEIEQANREGRINMNA